MESDAGTQLDKNYLGAIQSRGISGVTLKRLIDLLIAFETSLLTVTKPFEIAWPVTKACHDNSRQNWTLLENNRKDWMFEQSQLYYFHVFQQENRLQ